MLQHYPGTVIPNENGKDCSFATFADMIKATGGITLGQICSITGLEASTVQNWVKRGFVPKPQNKIYGERHLARILLISALRKGLQIDRIGALLEFVNGDTEDESDDIISEPELYTRFCTEICDSGDHSIDFLRDKWSKPPHESDSETENRLYYALRIMETAYLSGILFEECDKQFEKHISKGETKK